eukprot:scaffold678499_cov73-Prasinocladus_malaysianus.AAC.1
MDCQGFVSLGPKHDYYFMMQSNTLQRSEIFGGDDGSGHTLIIDSLRLNCKNIGGTSMHLLFLGLVYMPTGKRLMSLALLNSQATGLASGMGTLMGTAIRIPCEVLKQRLQIGAHENTREAFRVAVETSGVRGLFRGTAATLGREVPFYVLGMVGYEQLKKLVSVRTHH